MNEPVRVSWDYGNKGRPQSTTEKSHRKAEKLINWIKQNGSLEPQNVKIEPIKETQQTS